MPIENLPSRASPAALPTGKLSPDEKNMGRGSASSFLSKWVFVLLPLGYLWIRLVDSLRIEWSNNPQYGYGWLVPFLCVGLLIRRWQESGNLGNRPLSHLRFIAILSTFLAFLYLPTRLVEAGTPEWRPLQWMLGIETIGLTLCAIWVGKGRAWLWQLAFPILFFFVAVPWPTLVEQPLIQGLTRVSAAI